MSCRLRDRRWSKGWSRDAAQPEDGFTLPAKFGDEEVSMLCNAYEKTDSMGRDLNRATAAVAVAPPAQLSQLPIRRRAASV